ncbi:MAG: TetR/AcrR family transcriptional regulator [Lachnospiraceae bacterium]|nr:TetR/AcrR family transcriptional regulator [Lachnospiraceae bacterium]MCR5475987.1 TetR family transcriptional regulator [Lachnospiraceae bacterium]
MARKESITVDMILNAAFEMTRRDGLSGVTARRLAQEAGCSTQPIFRVYKNMAELSGAVYARAVEYFRTYYAEFPRTGTSPFANLGMAYIAFARKEKNLFKLLFVDTGALGEGEDLPERVSMYELLNGAEGNVVFEINLAKSQGCKDPGGMFMKMWIFIHGAACMTLSGDYDLTDEETMNLLEKAYQSFNA